MTAFTTAAFATIATKASSLSSQLQPLVVHPTTTSTCLSMTNYAAIASSWFHSIRIPSSLIAGSSLAALFALSKDSNEMRDKSNLHSLVWSTYHMSSLVGLLLSINVIVLATATSNSFLLNGSGFVKAASVYDFIMKERCYEFFLTRWSFFMSLFCFQSSICTRAIIDFNLLDSKRRRMLSFVLATLCGMTLHFVNFLNTFNAELPTLWQMTKQVVALHCNRSFLSASGVFSLAAGCLAVGNALWMIFFPIKSMVANLFDRLGSSDD